MERIGVMGGSFNPIHEGHLAMARAAMEQAGLDRVLFIPTGNPPHKRVGLAPAEDRYRMTCVAVHRQKGFEPSRIELDRAGIIYTVDTLQLLHEANPQAVFFFIIGEDTLHELPTWHEPERLYGLCTFLVLRRPGSKAGFEAVWRERESQGARLVQVDMPLMDISSTAIRGALAQGSRPQGLPQGVEAYLMFKGLYGDEKWLPQGAQWLDRLHPVLSASRFAHTLYVAACARELAQKHGVDTQKAVCAALLHDCAKCMPLEQMQSVARENRLTDDEAVLSDGNLLHSVVGAYEAKHTYGVEDDEVLAAIACHTLGRKGMTPLDMIVFLADKIEASRAAYPLLEAIRKQAETNLPKAVHLSLTSTVDYVRQRGGCLHPATLEVIAWLEESPAE